MTADSVIDTAEVYAIETIISIDKMHGYGMLMR